MKIQLNNKKIILSWIVVKQSMTEIYCVHCKKKTGTSHLVHKVARNGRHYVQGKCTVCGTKKTQFVSSKEGGSLFGSIAQAVLPALLA